MTSNTTLEDAVQRSAQTIRMHLEAGGRAEGRTYRPRVAVLLGSGWSGVMDAVEAAVDIPYGELPAFPVLGISGHAGLLRLGRVDGHDIIMLAGRKHAYETGDAAAMKGVIHTLAALGVQTLLQTNAAGSLDPKMPPGSLMLLSDHINMVQRSPLLGETGNSRFVGMTDAYDPQLRHAALQAAQQQGLSLHEGVYAWVLGPQFETPAEIRMLGLMGARAVGMSTVPETILARHAGLAVSLITNLAAGLSSEHLSHEHTLAMAQSGGAQASRLLRSLIACVSNGMDAGLSENSPATAAP
jgi:purine-nucleoside phosphorylase